jgi:hypothetical protein
VLWQEKWRPARCRRLPSPKDRARNNQILNITNKLFDVLAKSVFDQFLPLVVSCRIRVLQLGKLDEFDTLFRVAQCFMDRSKDTIFTQFG